MSINHVETAPECKICRSPTFFCFAVPSSKKTGQPMPDLPDDCPYYQCYSCHFCFSPHLDQKQHPEIYDAEYWEDFDPYACVSQVSRLVMLANSLVNRHPDSLDILDFGCGLGGFVDIARKSMQMNVWETDMNPPKVGKDFFLPQVNRKFDIIVSCEVIEHLPEPNKTFHQLRSWLKPGGALAFQTAQYDPNGEKRDWWYVGPDNGHISFYSREAFDYLFDELGGTQRLNWRGYAGVQAWRFD